MNKKKSNWFEIYFRFFTKQEFWKKKPQMRMRSTGDGWPSGEGLRALRIGACVPGKNLFKG